MQKSQHCHFHRTCRMKPGDRTEAEALATSVITPFFALLPRWGLQNDELVDVPCENTPYEVTLSPWRGTGRHFWVRPKGRRRTPFVSGFVDVHESGLWFQPEHYIPDRSRGQRQ